MSELLMKLKKDGKTVGYLLISKGKVWGKTIYENDEWSEWTNWGFMFDAAHPFVTKDKNGKDVFADDEVWFHWMGKKTKAKIVKDDLFTHLVSCEGEVQGLPRTFCKSDRFHIEIIEDKENE